MLDKKLTIFNHSSRMASALITLFLLRLFLSPHVSKAGEMDDFSHLLKTYVSQSQKNEIILNAVDYKNLKNDPHYTKVLEKLKNQNPQILKTKEEKMAFWINAYNIFAIKMIVDHYPVKSIKDAGSIFRPVWKKEIGSVGEKFYTLHEIEHEILRELKDPRIHAAIVCASVSCPDLRTEPYKKETLNDQLNDQLKNFLSNPQKGFRINKNKNIVYLSSIFKWFKGDFTHKGGVIPFLARYLKEDQKAYIKNNKYKIEYMPYDWDVNDKSSAGD